MPGRGPRSRAGTPCRDHEGNEFKSISEMCRHWNISPATYAGRARQGYGLEQCLTMERRHGPEKPVTDHLGNSYPNSTAMFKAYGINGTVYKYRHVVKGWSLEATLTTPLGDTDKAGAHACTDHLGNAFPSKKAMCEHWHVPRNVYFLRKKAGKSLSECLAPTRRNQLQQPVKDHLGQEFPCLDDMCAHWGILKSEYMQNVRNGLPLDQALTERTGRPDRPKDHLGNEHPSINAMCRAWGITKTTLRARLELGWTLEEILTHPENNSHLIRCRDHLGNAFPSQKAMLAYWGVSHTTYKHRLSKGEPLERALAPESLHTVRHRDHLGREFGCLQAMLEYWLVNVPTWHHRAKKLGMPLGQSLEHMAKGQECYPGVMVLEDYGGWLLAEQSGGRYVMSNGALKSHLRKLAMLDAIKKKDLPGGMRARHISGNWFLVWGAGPSPGVLLDQDGAWYERCRAKYDTSLATARGRQEEA